MSLATLWSAIKKDLFSWFSIILENLPEPQILAREIAENLQAPLEMFSSIYEELEGK
jgi:hypothetical protein